MDCPIEDEGFLPNDCLGSICFGNLILKSFSAGIGHDQRGFLGVALLGSNDHLGLLVNSNKSLLILINMNM